VPAASRAGVGPQYERHTELLALMAGGIAGAPFGPSPVVTPHGTRWTVASTRLGPPYPREVDWLVPAHVPAPAVESSASPLLSSLYRKGFIRPHPPASRHVPGVGVGPDPHPVNASG